jgi:hypothetical protein
MNYKTKCATRKNKLKKGGAIKIPFEQLLKGDL